MRAQLLSALLLLLTAASTVHSLVFIHSSSVQIEARKVYYGVELLHLVSKLETGTYYAPNIFFLFELKVKYMQKKKEIMEEDFVSMRYFEAVRMNVLYIENFLILQTWLFLYRCSGKS